MIQIIFAFVFVCQLCSLLPLLMNSKEVTVLRMLCIWPKRPHQNVYEAKAWQKDGFARCRGKIRIGHVSFHHVFFFFRWEISGWQWLVCFYLLKLCTLHAPSVYVYREVGGNNCQPNEYLANSYLLCMAKSRHCNGLDHDGITM